MACFLAGTETLLAKANAVGSRSRTPESRRDTDGTLGISENVSH